MADLALADQAIEAFLARTDALVTCRDPAGRGVARELIATLQRADKGLTRRLDAWIAGHGGGEVRFTEASLVAYREQVRVALKFVQDRLRGFTSSQALRAARLALSRVVALTTNLEHAFTGLTVPLRIDEAIVTRMMPSLLARHATSVDRYGTAMIRRVELELSQGFAEGISQREAVNRLVRMKGPTGMVSMRAVEIQPGMVVRLTEEFIPEGLFTRYRTWAWRVVRTETAEAQNAVAQAESVAARAELPDMKRKILAVMDQRTARDSLGVHGQVRAINEPFIDGAGRSYLRPPSRPNDRETVIPWREKWPDTERSRPLTQAEQEETWRRNQEWQNERARNRARAKRKA